MSRSRRASISGGAATLALVAALVLPAAATAAVPVYSPVSVLGDLTNTLSLTPAPQHDTVLEDDAISFGSQVLAVTQVGRYTTGAAAAAGYAYSPDGGQNWSKGLLPGLTSASPAPAGTLPRAVDENVAYDAMHATWLIGSVLADGSANELESDVSRSTNGTTWGLPVQVSTGVGPTGHPDKQWTVCDNTALSTHYGTCYQAFSQNLLAAPAENFQVYVARSIDGGANWSAPVATGMQGYNVQPLVQPSGNLVIVATDQDEKVNVQSVVSSDGGATFGAVKNITPLDRHPTGGGRNPTGLRTFNKPTTDVDASGRVWVAWDDCRFRAACSSSDIVYTTSLDGVNWSAVTRVPIDPVTSAAEYVQPSLAVDATSPGGSPRVGIVFQYLPNSACTGTACSIGTSFVETTDGGATWSARAQLSPPVPASYLPATQFQGRMPGDYMGLAFPNGSTAVALFPVAGVPAGSVFDQDLEASLIPPLAANAPPTASFIVACVQRTCSFDAGASGDTDGTTAAYAWDFGDGATAAGVTTSHPYAVGGAYSVTLTVTDSSGATAATSQPASPSPGPASNVGVVLAPGTIVADGSSTSVATATVTDAHGNRVPGETVGFSSTDSGVHFGLVSDHGDGSYSATITSSTVAHAVTVTATDGSVSPHVSGEATLTQGPSGMQPTTPTTPTTPEKPTPPKAKPVACRRAKVKHHRRTVTCTLTTAVMKGTKVTLKLKGRVVATGTASGRKATLTGTEKALKSAGTATLVLKPAKGASKTLASRLS